MRVKTTLAITLLLLTSQNCKARTHTLEEADAIIMILLFFVILLFAFGGVSLHYNRIISQRNEKLRRILNGLEAYRKLMNDMPLPLAEQEEKANKQKEQPKGKFAEVALIDEGQKFFVEMDARMTKEKPFKDPDFDHQAMIKFMGVTQETFCKLMPRYSDPVNVISYINSRRAEYGAQLIMQYSDSTIDEIANRCGFTNAADFISAFKFAFGITPNDYLNSIDKMFKKKK